MRVKALGDTEALQLPINELKKLSDYLETHEEDIAWRVNDFEELADLYILIYGREPRKDRNAMQSLLEDDEAF